MTKQSTNHTEPVKVFIEGRYRKLSRDLPQTKFFCPECRGKGCERCEGFGKLTRDSVQELFAWVALPRLKSRRNKFHGAGREDMDVRMLGSGRLFVFEALKCKNPMIDLDELAQEVNRRNEGRLEINSLRYCERKRIVEIKEAKCAKEYGARIKVGEGVSDQEIEEKLNALIEQGRFTIVQRTPQRVAHRRADLERERWLQIMSFEKLEDSWRVGINSAHGTYIKEAISGDEGRSNPSIGDLLGAGCVCLELDVNEVMDPEPESTES